MEGRWLGSPGAATAVTSRPKALEHPTGLPNPQPNYGYLLIDLKTTAQGDCRLRTTVLPGEEGFNQVGVEGNIPRELLKYLKQQNLSTDPHLPA